MAEIIKTSVGFGDLSGELAFTPLTGADYLTLDNADTRMTLILRNQNAQNAVVTVKSGDGSLSPLGDVTVAVGGSKTVAVPFARVESARVKILRGADHGKVMVACTVDTGGSLSGVAAALISVQ